MSRIPATNQAKNSELLLRHDLEDFSRDLLGLHTRFQNMFPVLANSSESTSPRDTAARNNASQPPTPALTPSQSAVPFPASVEREIRQEVSAKVAQEIDEINVRFTQLGNEFEQRVDDIYKHGIEPFEAEKNRVEEELAKIREENTKREQVEVKMREELWGVIGKMQSEIEELKKRRVHEIDKNFPMETQPTTEDWVESSPWRMRGQFFRDENDQNYTSSALVPFSSQVDKSANALSPKALGQSGTPASTVSGLDLTIQPANRGQQNVVGRQNAYITESEPTIPVRKVHSRSGLLKPPPREPLPPSLLSVQEDNLKAQQLQKLHAAAVPAQLRRELFRVREDSQPMHKPKSSSSHRRSNRSSSIQSITNNNDTDFSSQSIPSRFQPSRKTKSANELIDKHLSFIPNGWRSIIANTAKQLSPEDWGRSDARVLKKLEDHCSAFTNLEEILPNFKMAVPALRELMRDMGRHL
ncbi:unnamed protein product [Sordaria macrospora k-hell]|uniref:WGS project CABT00000000 data, contig 2.4 n=1 Tax=Sordaria macrospora (strain ATCC MYA-333 / DSM 997 / K(L3346) / K-hell) TaxID=771870 RepID=F7VQM7_SORMK|nr:uncharacterized protein SMAC_01375 [Sordaria macrospora k-hell]CCC07809.1 unnamed protein product [Sordaria macrospora k-hell]